MTSSQDTEITLGTGKLLVLFFGLVVICAVFFALGYTLGRKSEPAMAASTVATPQGTNASKPGNAPASGTAPPMTFYKSVEQKEPGPELTPAAETKADANAASAATSSSTPATSAADPAAMPAGSGYFVQVAAVSKQDDAEALVAALKKKDYPAFIASGTAADKFFHVQLGPFADIKDAEAVRTKLVNDGYNPILKK